jgi:DNA-binding MarR family transcriptional regulator
MSIKLTDTQLLILSAAAQREDRCIAAPPSLKGAAAKKTAAKLVAAGLVQEIKAKSGARVWRQDDATGQAYALQLTAAGLKAIAVEEAEAAEAASEISPTAPGEGQKGIVDLDAAVGSSAPPTAIAAPREGSKLAQVIGLLRREGGATIDQLAHAMGWLPHTTRAALTGLRKRGFGIDRRKAKDERAGAYVIVDQPKAAER